MRRQDWFIQLSLSLWLVLTILLSANYAWSEEPGDHKVGFDRHSVATGAELVVRVQATLHFQIKETKFELSEAI